MSVRTSVVAAVVLGVLWVLPMHVAAAEFSPKITEVTVFKDGHALVMSTAKTTLEKGWCRTREVPVPVLGTFWTFVKEPGARVDFVKSGHVASEEKRPCLTFDEMIVANKGAKAIIYEAPAGPSSGAVQHEGGCDADDQCAPLLKRDILSQHGDAYQGHGDNFQRQQRRDP